VRLANFVKLKIKTIKQQDRLKFNQTIKMMNLWLLMTKQFCMVITTIKTLSRLLTTPRKLKLILSNLLRIILQGTIAITYSIETLPQLSLAINKKKIATFQLKARVSNKIIQTNYNPTLQINQIIEKSKNKQ